MQATTKQIDFIKVLGQEAREAAGDNENRNDVLTILAKGMQAKLEGSTFSARSASEMIDALKDLKRNWRDEDRSSGRAGAEPEAGMYRQADGTIVRVYLGQRSGYMLMKQLVDTSQPHPEDPSITLHEYSYVGRAAYRLGNAERMTLAEAKEFGRMTGTCCNCGRRLDVPESVEAGIGPVCAKRFDS